MTIAIKRVYDAPSIDDGLRVLVDRLWPRALSKEKARLDLWEKNIALSNELRTWFHHEAGNWQEFCRRYTAELAARPDEVRGFRELLHSRVTLLYGAWDAAHNQAVVLRDFLQNKNTP